MPRSKSSKLLLLQRRKPPPDREGAFLLPKKGRYEFSKPLSGGTVQKGASPILPPRARILTGNETPRGSALQTGVRAALP
ncbi:MAG: hypothetical protein RR320_01865, partial [Oscillospiraceae bacterium]